MFFFPYFLSPPLISHFRPSRSESPPEVAEVSAVSGNLHRKMRAFQPLFFLCLVYSASLAAAQGSPASSTPSKWLTLTGQRPVVIAQGGFAGLFADSSSYAYNVALMTSLSDVILYCKVQLTKDGTGICFPSLKLDNASNIAQVVNAKPSTFRVDGVPLKGYFSVDFTINDLANVSLTQRIYTRSPNFDGSNFQIMTVEDVANLKPQGLWLNFENVAFFQQFNLSMRSFVLNVSRKVVVNFISSSDVGFLLSISQRFNENITKLIFQILEPNKVELSTNQTYGSLLQNLTFVKTFAYGILIDKSFIWPVDSSGYLLAHTSLVADAHRQGLEVYASDFANDYIISFNYSYAPVAEYLQFIDNGNFSVDGVLSPFPITPSEAIDCFSHMSRNSSRQVSPLVITNCGSSGDYPGCTDDAYIKAISDGADIIDCVVQMTKDEIAFCMSSINLLDSTNAASNFMNRITTIPEIKVLDGICTFSLTWNETQTLIPQILNPYAAKYQMVRNPAFKMSGKLLRLSEFLALAKNSSVPGVLISVENADYLAEKQKLDVIGAVLDALNSTGYSRQTEKRVMIQSTNSSVLKKFKEKQNYELVYKIYEDISGASKLALKDILKFAHATAITKNSVFPTSQAFTNGVTDVVQSLHLYNISVYVYLFRNEFVSQAWDFFSDSVVELNTFFMGAEIDGVITDFPKTAVSYKNNKCLGRGDSTPPYMTPVPPGGLLQVMAPQLLPPAEAPSPILSNGDVIEPPLPPVAEAPNASPNSPPPAPTSRNGQPTTAVPLLLSGLVMLLATGFLV